MLRAPPVARVIQPASRRELGLRRFRRPERPPSRGNRPRQGRFPRPRVPKLRGELALRAFRRRPGFLRDRALNGRARVATSRPNPPTTGSFFLINFILIIVKRKIRTKTKGNLQSSNIYSLYNRDLQFPGPPGEGRPKGQRGRQQRHHTIQSLNQKRRG